MLKVLYKQLSQKLFFNGIIQQHYFSSKHTSCTVSQKFDSNRKGYLAIWFRHLLTDDKAVALMINLSTPHLIHQSRVCSQDTRRQMCIIINLIGCHSLCCSLRWNYHLKLPACHEEHGGALITPDSRIVFPLFPQIKESAYCVSPALTPNSSCRLLPLLRFLINWWHPQLHITAV